MARALIYCNLWNLPPHQFWLRGPAFARLCSPPSALCANVKHFAFWILKVDFQHGSCVSNHVFNSRQMRKWVQICPSDSLWASCISKVWCATQYHVGQTKTMTTNDSVPLLQPEEEDSSVSGFGWEGQTFVKTPRFIRHGANKRWVSKLRAEIHQTISVCQV